MATIVSRKGQLILPEQIRDQLHLSPDDGFEVTMEDADIITLRRVSQPANRGLIDLLLACPAPFEIPPRERDTNLPPRRDGTG